MRGLPGRLVGMLALTAGLLGGSGLSGQDGPGREPPGIYPVLVVAPPAPAGTTVELHLRRVAVPEPIASYQGVLRYDARRFTLVSARIPEGIAGAWHEPARGTVRFAGVSTRGIEGGAVLTLTLRAAGPVEADAFELTLQEVVAGDFRSLLGSVRQAGTRPAVVHREP